VVEVTLTTQNISADSPEEKEMAHSFVYPNTILRQFHKTQTISITGCAMDKAVRCQPVSTEPRFVPK
jgi:hypothetical protein